MLTSLLFALLPQAAGTPVLYISQQPDHVFDNLWFSDVATYDPFWGTTQYMTESFVVKPGMSLTPTELVFWGGDFKASSSAIPHTKIPTEYTSSTFFPWAEWQYTASMAGAPKLGEGAYHIEVYNDTTFTSDGTWGWIAGPNDPDVGQPGTSFTDDGGSTWNINANAGLAFELYGELDLPLAAGTSGISMSAGGSQALTLDAGIQRAGDLYLVLGSLSGITPGISFGNLHLNLNWDAYSTYTYLNPNTAVLSSTFGSLDSLGKANASINLPAGLDPALVGMQAVHAFVAVDLNTLIPSLASNPVSMDLLP